jgi:hypothetical protein
MSDDRNLRPARPLAASSGAAVLDPGQVRSPEQLIEDLSRFLSHTGDAFEGMPPKARGIEPPHAHAYTIEDDEFDDVPMPIPSTWRTPEIPKEERGWFAEQTWAAVLGFVVGLAIIVPAILFATARFGALDVPVPEAGTPLSSETTAGVYRPAGSVDETFARAATVLPVKGVGRMDDVGRMDSERVTAAAQLEARAHADPTVATAPEITVVPRDEPQAEPPRRRIAQTFEPLSTKLPNLRAARDTIASGDVMLGRKLLAQLASSGDPQAMFALAETYDPNMLAAWAMQGIEADTGKARLFYSMALSQGLEAARIRLQALD